MTNATEFWIILKSICIQCIILYHFKSNVVTLQVAGANGWSRSCWWLLTVFWKRFNGVGGRGTTGRWGKIKKRWLCYSRASKNTKFYKSWFLKIFFYSARQKLVSSSNLKVLAATSKHCWEVCQKMFNITFLSHLIILFCCCCLVWWVCL